MTTFFYAMLSTPFYQFDTIQSDTQQLQLNYTTMSKSTNNRFITPGKSLDNPSMVTQASISVPDIPSDPTDPLQNQTQPSTSVPDIPSDPIDTLQNQTQPSTSVPDIPSKPIESPETLQSPQADESAIVQFESLSVESNYGNKIGNFLVMPESKNLYTSSESPAVFAFRNGSKTDHSDFEKLCIYKEALISAVQNQLVCDIRLRIVHLKVFESVEDFNRHRSDIVKYLAETYWERIQPPCCIEQYFDDLERDNNPPIFIITHGYYKHCMKLAITKFNAIKHNIYDTEEEAAALKLKYKNAKIAATRRRTIDEAIRGLEIDTFNEERARIQGTCSC